MPNEPKVAVVDERADRIADLSALEEAGVGFDPTRMHLDLTKDEKRRMTALMMAVQAYKELIIKEADYLIAAADLARRNEGPALKAATIDAMVDAAIKFDGFIAGTAKLTGETTGRGTLAEAGAKDDGRPVDE